MQFRFEGRILKILCFQFSDSVFNKSGSIKRRPLYLSLPCRTSYVEEHANDKCSINYIVYQNNLKYQTEGKMEAGEPVVVPDFASSSGCVNVTDLLVSVFNKSLHNTYSL